MDQRRGVVEEAVEVVGAAGCSTWSTTVSHLALLTRWEGQAELGARGTVLGIPGVPQALALPGPY